MSPVFYCVGAVVRELYSLVGLARRGMDECEIVGGDDVIALGLGLAKEFLHCLLKVGFGGHKYVPLWCGRFGHCGEWERLSVEGVEAVHHVCEA